MAETPEYFDNVTIGQYAMTGVPLKVYVGGVYLMITDPDDVENPLMGFGMMPNGEMEKFDYKQVEHLLVSGNVIDIETYKKAMEDDEKEEEGEEKEEEGEDKEAPGEDLSKDDDKEEEGGDDKEEESENPFESVMPSLASLVEITKDVKKAREKALDAEEKALKDKRKALDDEPITESQKYDLEAAVKSIRDYNRGSYRDDMEELAEDILKNLGFDVTRDNIDATVEHLMMSADGDDIPEDTEMVRELYPMLESVNEKKGSVDESVIGDILIIADENNTYEAFTAELVRQKYVMPNELKDPTMEQELRAMYDSIHESVSLKSLLPVSESYMGNKGDEVMITNTKKPIGNIPGNWVLEKPDGSAMVDMFFDSEEAAKKYAKGKGLKLVPGVNEARKPRGYYEKKFKHLKKKPKYKKGDEVVYVQDLGGPDELSPETSRVRKVSKGLAGFKYDLTNFIQTNDSEILGLAESVNEGKFPNSFIVNDILHYSPMIDGKPKKLYKGTYKLKNDKGDTAVYFNQAFKSEIEIDNDDIFNFKRLKSNFKVVESVNEDHMGAPYEYDNISEPYSIKVGDMVKNTNPSCPHNGSQGMVRKVITMPNDIGKLIKYVVMNQGDTYQAGDLLTKTPDQLELM